MRHRYVHIARKLKCLRTSVVFGSLCRDTYRIINESMSQIVVAVSSKTYEASMPWVKRHAGRIKKLTLNRCVTSPFFRMDWDTFHRLEHLDVVFCRVYPYSVRARLPGLKTIRLHQLEPGGCLTSLLDDFPNLEHISVTCTPNWGLVPLGPLRHASLQTLDVRAPSSDLIIRGPLPSVHTIRLHADSLSCDLSCRIPVSCRSVDIENIQNFPFERFFRGQYTVLENLKVVTTSVIMLPSFPSLKSLKCRCDVFVFSYLPPMLSDCDIDVQSCVVFNNINLRNIQRLRLCEQSRPLCLDDVV